jgi:mannosyltransferase
LDVAFVSFLYPNVDRTGGSTYTLNLCKALAKHVDLTLFVPDVGNLQEVNTEIKYSPCRVLNVGLLRPTTFVMSVSRKIRQKKFDIIHSHTGSGMFLDRLSVETFHHKPPRLEALPTKTCLRKSKHIIAVSPRAKNELNGMGFQDAKITVINNGIDSEHFAPNANARSIVKQKADLKKDDKVIFSVPADGTRRKNLPLMFKTTRYLRENTKGNLILLMVGSKSVEKKAMRLARKFKVEGNLHFIIDAPYSDMPLYYSASDFLAHPSTREGFGFVLLESIASGKPFVSMDIGIAQDLANKGLGYVAHNEHEFIEKCLRMSEKPLNVWNIGNRFVNENYSWERCAEETVKVYESIF